MGELQLADWMSRLAEILKVPEPEAREMQLTNFKRSLEQSYKCEHHPLLVDFHIFVCQLAKK